MVILLSIIHVLVCLILILIVLLQSGKGADLAGAFGGGGSQTAFGARGTATFLSKLTTGAAVVFMLTSFTLSLSTTRNRGSSVMEGAKSAPKQTAPPSPGKAPPAQNPSSAPPQQNPGSTPSKP
jgi:preprotein translocase subunit SecG